MFDYNSYEHIIFISPTSVTCINTRKEKKKEEKGKLTQIRSQVLSHKLLQTSRNHCAVY